jgi:hypothetical protein
MGHATEKLPQLYQQMSAQALDGGPLAGGIRLAFRLNQPAFGEVNRWIKN